MIFDSCPVPVGECNEKLLCEMRDRLEVLVSVWKFLDYSISPDS